MSGKAQAPRGLSHCGGSQIAHCDLAKGPHPGDQPLLQTDLPPLWDLECQFEPVLIFVSLPLIPHQPRFTQRESLLAGFEGLLLGPRVLQAGDGEFRHDLRQLFSLVWGLC